METNETPRDESVSKYRIQLHKGYRHFAVYEGETLVVITVYRKGAEEIVKRLTSLEEALAKKPA